MHIASVRKCLCANRKTGKSGILDYWLIFAIAVNAFSGKIVAINFCVANAHQKHTFALIGSRCESSPEKHYG